MFAAIAMNTPYVVTVVLQLRAEILLLKKGLISIEVVKFFPPEGREFLGEFSRLRY